MSITINQIAALAGVSRGTVDRALNNRSGVKPEVRERIQEIARNNDYRPNAVAKALKSQEKRVNIGVVCGPDMIFSRQLLEGIEIARSQYAPMGVNILHCFNPDSNEGLEVALNAMLEQGVDAIALKAVDTPWVRQRINSLTEAGVPVVTFNSDVKDSARMCYVGQEFALAGRVAAQLMGNSLRGRGKVLIISEEAALHCHRQRVGAFQEVIAERFPEIEIVDFFLTPIDREREYTLAKEALLRYPDLDGLYSSAESVGIVRAIRELGLTDQITLICPDLIPEIVETAMQDNCIDYFISQEPQKQTAYAIKILVEYLNYGIHPAADRLCTAVDVRVKDSAAMDTMGSIYLDSAFKP